MPAPLTRENIREGEAVQVYSASSKMWLDAVVEKLFDRECVDDGYLVPAGYVKVSSSVGMKYVRGEEVSTILRREVTPRTQQVWRASVARPKPAGRANAGPERLDWRDRWNTYELRLQEIFVDYDKDNSGSLDESEFQTLLMDFNEGRKPTDDELNFMLRLADKDHDGKINLGELHYALRAWHSYRNLDDNVLQLFAEFDTDHSGRLDPGELSALLAAMNGGKPVKMEEVRHVMRRADLVGDGAINRCELLGAIAAWYSNVERKETDMPSLIVEALTRMSKDHDHPTILTKGRQSYSTADSLVRGGMTGYDQVDPGDDLGQQPIGPGMLQPGGSFRPPRSHTSVAGETESSVTTSTGQPLRNPAMAKFAQATPHMVSCMSKLCYVVFPFFLGWLMAVVGWENQDNQCPRNLDGILIWWGVATIIFSGLMYLDAEEVIVFRIRVALAVVMFVLNLVGFLWTLDPDVQSNMAGCGYFLYLWSISAWTCIPVSTFLYGLYHLAQYIKNLRNQEKSLSHNIIF